MWKELWKYSYTTMNSVHNTRICNVWNSRLLLCTHNYTCIWGHHWHLIVYLWHQVFLGWLVLQYPLADVERATCITLKSPAGHTALWQRCACLHIQMGISNSDMARNNPAPTNCVHSELQWCGMFTLRCNNCECVLICMCPSRLETRTKESSACASSVIANTACEFNVIAC